MTPTQPHTPERIVTRPDFDGIVCAVLLRDAEKTAADIRWMEPNEIQSGQARIRPGDILANLPWHPDCALWFDHHVSNRPEGHFRGAFDIVPSAARVIYDYYLERERLDRRYDELIRHTDIIDGALLNQDQVGEPEKYPHLLLSMTIKNDRYKDVAYWNQLVDQLGHMDINEILAQGPVKTRCEQVVEENKAWASHLKAHTRIENRISITDFRALETVPSGNRFLSYAIFPDTIASVRIRNDSQGRLQVSVGKSIFNQGLNVNIGRMLACHGGGGHAGAGGCTLESETADRALEQILETLFENRPDTGA